MEKSNHLWGFRHNETGLFKPTYYTKSGHHTACFRTKLNAEKRLAVEKKFDPDMKYYEVAIMVETE